MVNAVRFPKVFPFRRMPMSVLIQRRMLSVLDLGEEEWLQALQETKRA